MYTSVITSQGTITLPAALRKRYGANPGTRVRIADTGTGITIVTPPKPKTLAEVQKHMQAALRARGIEPGSLIHLEKDAHAGYLREKYGKK
jgi:bifunctional DNA-binding transcriptional regulator/antitoxin component of YhaV-PrlF toxin-antitoxin module